MILVAESNMEPSYAIKREVMHRGQKKPSNPGASCWELLTAGLTYAQARQKLCLLKPGTLATPWHAGAGLTMLAQCARSAPAELRA